MNPPESSSVPIPARDLSALVTEVFRHWHAASLRFVILRNYENLPQETGNDIDVLVAADQLARAETLLVQAAQAVGYQVHNRAEFSPVSVFLFHPESGQQIQFDLFAKLAWRGFNLIAAASVLRRAVPRGGFFVPHPEDEAVINLLTRLIYHGYVKEKYRPAITAQIAANAAAVTAELAQTFGGPRARALLSAARAGDWEAVGRQSGGLRRSLLIRGLGRHPLRTLGALIHDAVRLTGRFWRPPGITVVLVGADGCGKSTVAEQLVAALRGTFHENKSLRVHWKPAVFTRHRRASRAPTSDPHGQPPRGPFRSALLLLYHWTEFFAGYWMQLRPVLFRNGLVLVDRYHYDFVVDPRRFRLHSLPGLAQGLFRWLPAPDLIFLLDAPAEVLQSRKQEVPLAETARQRAAYRAELGRWPQAHIMDATQPAATVARQVVAQILNYMAHRQRRRRPPAA